MYKVLIADDNKQIVSILSEYCKKNNFTVSAVFDGEAALKEIEENKFDIILLDVMMPKNDESEKIFTFDNLEIDLNNFTVKVNDEIISLTKKEIEILWTLSTNQNKVFTRENLLDLIWGFDYFGESRTVDTHIKRLRAKLDNYEHKKWNIKTIWGVGYKFDILEK